MASTAAVVVLPTPPEPQHTMMRRSRTSSSRSGAVTSRDLSWTSASRPSTAASTDRPACRPRPDRARPRTGTAGGAAAAGGARQAGELLGLQADAVPPEVGGGGAARRPRRGAGRRRRPRRPRRVGVEAGEVGVDAVDHHRTEARRRPGPRAEGGLDQLVDRGLLGQRDEHDLAAVGSSSSSSTSRAWVLIGPTFTASSSPWAERRNVMAWPAAGASSTMRSAAPLRSSCLTLPSTRMSRMPGAAVATTSSAPLATRRLRDAGQAVVLAGTRAGRRRA